MSPRCKVLNPGSVKVTSYVPGLQVDDLVLARTVGDDRRAIFSISAGLDASTLTPGMTAPVCLSRRRRCRLERLPARVPEAPRRTASATEHDSTHGFLPLVRQPNRCDLKVGPPVCQVKIGFGER